MKRLELKRFSLNQKRTLGDLFLMEDNQILLMLKTLELPWLNNSPKVSCIPVGQYKAKMHTSPKFGWCLWLQDVPGRSGILIHQGNYTDQILGCILPGIIHDDINRDGITDVKYSNVAMEALKFYLQGISEIDIWIN